MFASSLSTLLKFYNLLTAPHSSVEARDQRRQARLLASVTVFLLVFGISTEFIAKPIINSEPFAVNWRSILPIFSFTSFGYAFSRSKYYNVGAILTVLAFSISVALQFVTPGVTGYPGIVIFLIVPILLCSLFVSTYVTTIIGSISALIIVALIVQLPNVDFDNSQFVLFMMLFGIVLFSMSYRNVLERDRQEALVESEKRYRTLSETVFDGLVDIEDGLITRANPGFIRIFGHVDTSVEGSPLADFIPNVHELFHSTAGEEGMAVEMQGVSAGGVLLDLEVARNSQVVNRSKIDTIAIRDISERKRTEEALRHAQRMDSLGVLTSGIAHDFNNMLTGILAQTSLAEFKLSKDDPAYTHIRKAKSSAASAADLTRQLLVYAGKAHTETQQLDLNQVVRDTLIIVDATLPNNVEIKANLLPTPLLVNGDYGQLQQVVLNLVINGIEAMQSHIGCLQVITESQTIVVTQQSPPNWGQKSLPPGDYVRLLVQDSGDGMNDSTKEHIFDPFFTTKEEGHGLGLSAILGIVRGHSGIIDVDSTLGEGTTFSVLFPQMVRKLESNGTTLPMQEFVERMQSPLILVVDDEEPIRESVADILETAGMRVITAPNGQEGVERYKENQLDIDLAILDLKMPVMSGEETFDALRTIDPAVKVIVSSGYGEEDILERIKSKGIMDFLQKPYDFDMLIAKIQDVL